jgi:hypothetical protein
MRTVPGLVAQVADGRDLGFDLLQARRHVQQQALAGFGGRDAARGARQQAHAQARLERADDVAERRLRHAELGCGACEAAFPGDGEEHEDVIDIVAGHRRGGIG